MAQHHYCSVLCDTHGGQPGSNGKKQERRSSTPAFPYTFSGQLVMFWCKGGRGDSGPVASSLASHS